MRKVSLILLFLTLTIYNQVSADEIVMRNGERIVGQFLSEDRISITIDSPQKGLVKVQKEFIRRHRRNSTPRQIAKSSQKRIQRPQPVIQKALDDIELKRSISLGFNATGGNTEDNELNLAAKFSRKSRVDEWSGHYKAYVSSANKEQDGRKFNAELRYAHSFTNSLKWYYFFKLEGDHDRFADIDYRIIPSSGVGYWFHDEKDKKTLLELALGFEKTEFRDGRSSDNEAILIPRFYIERRLFGDLSISRDTILYPSLSDFGEFRLHSETALSNPINDNLSWKVTFVNDYNSDVEGDTEESDYRIQSSMDYSF